MIALIGARTVAKERDMPFVDFLITWIVRAFRAKRRANHLAKAKQWPVAQGRVVGGQSKRAENPVDAFSAWTAELIYFYIVHGDYFSGQTLLPPESEDEVLNQIATWKDRAIVLRYCPAEPSKSFFLAEDQIEGNTV